METRTLKYGSESITYAVEIRPRRRTLGIEVHPDGRVVVLAPPSCSEMVIAQKVRLRARWVSRQLAQFGRYEKRTVPRQYLSGECHRYLGRQYRLRVVPNDPTADANQVKLTRGSIIVSGPKALSRNKVRELLQQWYSDRASQIFSKILAEAFSPFARRGLSLPVISVRLMQRRWGSLSSSKRMTLNIRLIYAPRMCIEYVIVHELCHLLHNDHSLNFFHLLRKVMPDWQARKQRLESL